MCAAVFLLQCCTTHTQIARPNAQRGQSAQMGYQLRTHSLPTMLTTGYVISLPILPTSPYYTTTHVRSAANLATGSHSCTRTVLSIGQGCTLSLTSMFDRSMGTTYGSISIQTIFGVTITHRYICLLCIITFSA